MSLTITRDKPTLKMKEQNRKKSASYSVELLSVCCGELEDPADGIDVIAVHVKDRGAHRLDNISAIDTGPRVRRIGRES
jgi:hypothetical protein